MKTRVFAVALASLLILGALAIFRFGANAAEPKKPLDLTVTDVTGKKITLSDYRGNVVVIDLWATWCGYCVEEMPEIVAYQKEAEQEDIPLQFIGLSVDRPQDKKDVLAVMKEMKVNYPVAIATKRP